ncbi:uncharacterized protein LOC128557309 [Mercenaria mercenaria]|uniref:uncharacterized protein LOC128557309 n=1 Tax=Mercenaria mercenaria TaxID=6596 RepID=UPI00234E9514|nr:uncharacterized protein LOC128557309 [Mercenaria mercenaria]
MENDTLANNIVQQIMNEKGIIPEWSRYTLIGFIALVAFTGIPGNAAVITVLSKLHDKISTDIYILAMASMDLIASSISTSFHILRYEPTAWKALASSTFCRLHSFTKYLTNISATSLLAATAFDRHMRTSTGNTLTKRLPETTKAKRVFALVGISSFVYSLFFLLTTTLDSTTLNCRMEEYDAMIQIFRSVLVLFCVLTFVVIIVCYARIAMMQRRHLRRVHEIRMNTRPMNTRRPTWPLRLGNQPLRENKHRRRNLTEIPTIGRQFTTDATHTNMLQRFNRQNNVTAEQVEIKKESKGKKLREDQAVCIRTENHDITQPSGSRKETFRRRETMPSVKINCIKMLPTNIAIDRKRKLMNCTSLMMFLISLVNISTWSITWSTPAYWASTDSPSHGLLLLIEKLYMINCMIKPILYMLLSSEFRQKARDIFNKV